MRTTNIKINKISKLEKFEKFEKLIYESLERVYVPINITISKEINKNGVR